MNWAEKMWDDAMKEATRLHALKPLIEEIKRNPQAACQALIDQTHQIALLRKHIQSLEEQLKNK